VTATGLVEYNMIFKFLPVFATHTSALESGPVPLGHVILFAPKLLYIVDFFSYFFGFVEGKSRL
jgi:hypothetical protein